MQVETRNEAAVAIEETVLLEDMTHSRPTSTEHKHNEQFYFYYTPATDSYVNTATGN